MVENDEDNEDVPSEWFPSLNALRMVHFELLNAKHGADVLAPDLIRAAEAFVQKARETGRLLDERGDRDLAQTLLGFWAVQLDRAGRTPPDLTLEKHDATLLPELREEDCPYLGLDAFGEADGGVFFGRSSQTKAMIDCLNTNRLLAIVGPSGSGKSSLALAGLLPALRRGDIAGSQDWHFCAVVKPGSNPLASLGRALREGSAPELLHAETFATDPGALGRRMGDHGRSAVLVVDQFEELFALCSDEAMRTAFVASLLGVLADNEHDHRVVITMRSDFEEYLPRFREFYDTYRRGKFDLPPMTASELRRAIEEPGKLVGLKLEEGLADALVRDVLGERAGLPLLQFTLLKLWEHRRRNRLTMEDYRQLGGGRLALERSAEQVFDAFLRQDQARAKYVFLRMVRPGEGLEVTSRRILRKSLYRVAGDREAIDQVVERLVRSRLVRLSRGDVPDDEQIEIAHEALVRNWTRLAEWVENERARIRQRIRLTSAAEQWESVRRDPGALLRGVSLEEASHYDDLNALETEYVQVSRAAFEEEQASWRRLANEASRQARVATARQLAAQSQLTRFSQRSLLLALEALRITARENEPRIPGAEEALWSALSNAVGRGLGKCHRGSIGVIRGTPDDRWLITGGNDKTVRLWAMKPELAAPTSIVLRGHEGSVERAAVSPDSRWLATGGGDRTVRVWDLCSPDIASSGRVVHTFEWAIRAVAISPDGRSLVVATEGNVIYRWKLGPGCADGPPEELRGHAWGIRWVDFSADARWMLSGSDDGTARLWDLRKIAPDSVVLAGSGKAIWSVKVTADGCWLVAGRVDGTVCLWRADLPNESPVVLECGTSVTAMAATPDSRKVIAGCSDSKVRVWDLEDPRAAPTVLAGHEDWISVAVVTDDNRWLVTGSGDSTVRIWDLARLSEPPVVMRGHDRCVRSVATGRHSQLLATSGDDGNVHLVDLRSPASPRAPRIIETSRAPIAMSPDSRWLATASQDHAVLLCELTQLDALPRTIHAGGRYIRTMKISPDGHWLAVGSEGSALVVVALEGGLEPRYLLGHAWGIRALAFSPDSRWLASGSDDHTLRLWSMTDQPVETWRWRLGDGVTAVAISPNQRWLIAGDYTGTVTLWEFANLGAGPRVLTRRPARVELLRVSPDSRWLVVGGYKENQVQMWDLAGPGLPVDLAGHGEWVTDVAISHDSELLVTVSEDPLVRLWRMSDLSDAPRILRGHEWGIRSVAFSPDGRFLATGSDDRTVRLWPLEAEVEDPVVLRGHAVSVTDVAIAPDDRWLVTASAYGSTRVWNRRLDELIQMACDTAGRNFTLEEWKQYFPGRPYSKTCERFPAPIEAIQEEMARARALAAKSDRAGASAAFRKAADWAADRDDLQLIREFAKLSKLCIFEDGSEPTSNA